MAGDRYFIQGQNDIHFITCTVVYWIDLFTRPEYKELLTNSLNYCIDKKGLEVYAYVIMSNHIHLLCAARTGFKISDILRDFKKYTSRQLIQLINEINESRRDWMLKTFAFEAKRSGRAKNYKIWKDDNHAVNMTDFELSVRIDYIHNNPVVQEIVSQPEDYIYSSAMDYIGRKGKVKLSL
jgi:REP element-mobilizing transposase RayT